MFSRLAAAFGWSKQDARVLVVGLDNSGKTTIINSLNPSKSTSAEVVPTVGFQVEEFTKSNVNLTVFDMSGQSRYRSLWEHYYLEVQAIIFVLDSADRVRMCVAKDELSSLLGHRELQGRPIPILFYANKMDLPGAMEPVEIVEELELHTIENQPWHIMHTDALSGTGIEEGLRWLVDVVTHDGRSRGGKGTRK